MSRTHRRATGRRGQSLVEFALVVPLLLLLVVGVIEFGRAWNVNQVVTFAARQGARKAAVLNAQGLSAPDITDSVVDVVTTTMATVNYGCGSCVTIDGAADPAGDNGPVTVTVSVPYQFVIFGPVMALAGQSFDGAIDLRSTAVMRNE
jgi:Flp pilus assembly protein TadG